MATMRETKGKYKKLNSQNGELERFPSWFRGLKEEKKEIWS